MEAVAYIAWAVFVIAGYVTVFRVFRSVLGARKEMKALRRDTGRLLIQALLSRPAANGGTTSTAKPRTSTARTQAVAPLVLDGVTRFEEMAAAWEPHRVKPYDYWRDRFIKSGDLDDLKQMERFTEEQ